MPSNDNRAKRFSIAIAGTGPLFDQVWGILNSEGYNSALSSVSVVAFLRHEDAKAGNGHNTGIAIFSSCEEMFKAMPELQMVVDTDEAGSYLHELHQHAPLSVDILNSRVVRYFCRAINDELVASDVGMQILHLHESFTAMLNHLNEDVILFDSRGIALEVNDYFLQRVNGERKDFIGKPCKKLEGEGLCCAKEGGLCPLERAIASKTKVSQIYSRENAEELQYFKLEAFPLPADLGPPRFILTREDITPIFKLQQRLHESEKMAAIGELSTYIAHEIRNPLFAIGGFAKALLHSPSLDEEGQEKATIIFEEAQRLDDILKNILNFSSPEQAVISEFNLEKLVAQTVKIMAMADETRKVETGLQIVPQLPHAKGNSSLLKQCLINIIKNAYEAMPDGGKLGVKVGPASAGMLEVLVQDSGPGIETDIMSKLFNPFFSTKDKGAGLGLPMTKKLIEDMGGHLDVTSKVGAGTAVRLLLPSASDRAGPEAEFKLRRADLSN